jgi:hypothetical protein
VSGEGGREVASGGERLGLYGVENFPDVVVVPRAEALDLGKGGGLRSGEE